MLWSIRTIPKTIYVNNLGNCRKNRFSCWWHDSCSSGSSLLLALRALTTEAAPRRWLQVVGNDGLGRFDTAHGPLQALVAQDIIALDGDGCLAHAAVGRRALVTTGVVADVALVVQTAVQNGVALVATVVVAGAAGAGDVITGEQTTIVVRVCSLVGSLTTGD